MNYQFPPDFFFGVSNAANQVEDNLEDNWLRFSRQNKLRCFQEQHLAQHKTCIITKTARKKLTLQFKKKAKKKFDT